jgi:ribosomal protein S12 methylthiotransferase accessory factor
VRPFVTWDGLARKNFHNGTHRLVCPEETIARVSPLTAKLGITRIANVTGLDTVGIPVVIVCRPNSRSLAVSQGKGLDLAAAKASGLMESIELYHAERITLPVKLASYEDLQHTHQIVDVTQLPRSSSKAFRPNLPLLWIEGFDLLQNESVWVPYEMVHTNYTMQMRIIGAGVFSASSNGLASGNHLLEAISHGICEVVERDSTTLWHLKGEARYETRVNLDTVTDSNCRQVLEKYERAAIDVAVWETTTNIGISSFICTIIERAEASWRRLHSALGMGCHPVRQIALLRALTEAAQSRLTVIAGSRDDVPRADYERYRDLEVLQRIRKQLDVKGPMRNFQDGPTWESDTFEEDIAWQLERLQSVGIRHVVAVNLTKAEYGLPVVRMVIPGLEGMHSMPDYVQGELALRVVKG